MTSPIDRAVARMLTVLTLSGAIVTISMAAPQSKPKKPPAGLKKPTAAQVAAGKKVYEDNKCASCHMIDGKGGKAGPDLSNEGATPKHTPKWLEDEVKDPKSHKADSKMPAFATKIQGKDLSNLVAYLGSLKKK